MFVNNASFGAYAEIVETPAYRGDKLGTTLDVLPGLLQGQRGARLAARAGDAEITAPQALLVSNNRYGSADIAGLNRRVRLDGGVLGVVGVTVSNADRPSGCCAAGVRRPDRADREGGDGDRRHAADPGRRRWRGVVAAGAGGVHHPPRRAPRAGAAQPAGRHPARAAGELLPAAAARLLAVLAAGRYPVTGAYEQVTGLADVFARAGELAVSTMSSTSNRWSRPGTAASRHSTPA